MKFFYSEIIPTESACKFIGTVLQSNNVFKRMQDLDPFTFIFCSLMADRAQIGNPVPSFHNYSKIVYELRTNIYTKMMPSKSVCQDCLKYWSLSFSIWKSSIQYWHIDVIRFLILYCLCHILDFPGLWHHRHHIPSPISSHAPRELMYVSEGLLSHKVVLSIAYKTDSLLLRLPDGWTYDIPFNAPFYEFETLPTSEYFIETIRTLKYKITT